MNNISISESTLKDKKPQVSLFIPTYNATKHSKNNFTKTLETIKAAGLHRVLIIDSSSTDDTVEVVKSFGFECIVILKEDFDHGGTRQLGLSNLSDSDIIVYMTQDVLLEDPASIHNLAQVLIDHEKIAGVYGRQLPHRNANVFAKHLRNYNYRDTSYIRSMRHRFVAGMRCVFSSDSFAAYRVDALKAVGGFPDHLIMGEDSFLFAKFLRAGYHVAYSADAICLHSHNYSIKENFQRYFDIGVFHHSENWILQEFGSANKDGLKFLLSELRAILYSRPWLLPMSAMHTGAKYIGYKLGRNYDQLGVRLCRRLSKNKEFWW